MSVLDQARLAQLAGAVCAARQLQMPWNADGKCYLYALCLADIAEQEGIRTWLAGFMLRADPHYADHWAVALEPGSPYLHDPSFAQVHNSGRLCVDARHDYPSDYVGPLYYPASRFLPVYRAWLRQEVAGRRLLDDFLEGTAEFDGGLFRQHVITRTREILGKKPLIDFFLEVATPITQPIKIDCRASKRVLEPVLNR